MPTIWKLFIAAYTDNVEIYDLPGRLLAKGKDAIRKDYAFIEQFPTMSCNVRTG